MNGSLDLTLVIPAFNEELRIGPTLERLHAHLAARSMSYEILVVDDGSSDGTGDIVRGNADRFPRVTLLVNERNLGFGSTYRRGVTAATREHVVMVHGDNAWSADTLAALFARVGDADIIIGFTRNMWRARPLGRTLISKAFTLIVNIITGRRLNYYNGLQIHRADVLEGLAIQSSGYGFQAEVLVKALRRTRTFVEVPMDLTERTRGESKAFRLKNAVDVLRTIGLLCDIEWGLAKE
jgi:glycosyltransferase involved in cell wall biosynthesis